MDASTPGRGAGDASGERRSELESLAREDSGSLPGELWAFLRESRKWWLLPVVFTLLAVGLLVLVMGSPAGAFLYALF